MARKNVQAPRLNVMEDILREMFGPRGRGPMRATGAGKRVDKRRSVLEDEQERLIQTWRK